MHTYFRYFYVAVLITDEKTCINFQVLLNIKIKNVINSLPQIICNNFLPTFYGF